MRLGLAMIGVAALTVSCRVGSSGSGLVHPPRQQCRRPEAVPPIPTVEPATLPPASTPRVAWLEKGGDLLPNDAGLGLIAYTATDTLHIVDDAGHEKWSWMSGGFVDVDLGDPVVVLTGGVGDMTVVGFDLASGAKVWTTDISRKGVVPLSIETVDGWVYVQVEIPTNEVMRSHETTSRQLWVLDAATGTLLWRITGNLIGAGGSTVVVEGPESDCRFLALDARTGRPRVALEQPRPEFRLGIDEADAVVAGGMVVLATHIPTSQSVHVVATDLASGRVRWRAQPRWEAARAYGAVSVLEMDGRLFVSTFEASADDAIAKELGLLLSVDAFDLTSGAWLWRSTTTVDGDPGLLLGVHPKTFGTLFDAGSTVAVPVGDEVLHFNLDNGLVTRRDLVELEIALGSDGFPDPAEVIVTPDGTFVLGKSSVTSLS